MHPCDDCPSFFPDVRWVRTLYGPAEEYFFNQTGGLVEVRRERNNPWRGAIYIEPFTPGEVAVTYPPLTREVRLCEGPETARVKRGFFAWYNRANERS